MGNNEDELLKNKNYKNYKKIKNNKKHTERCSFIKC